MPGASCFMNGARRAVAIISLAAIATALPGAQAPAPSAAQPTFRTGTTLVEVSAIVTRDGVPVTDLRADEVRVLDDGVEQPLVAFEYVDLTTVEGPAQRRDFVLVIDDWHIEPRLTQPVQDVALRFIEALSPHDRLAIVTTGPHELVQQLSRDREAAGELIRRIRGQKGPSFGGMVEMKARIALEVVRNVAHELGADAAERRAVVIVSEGHPGFGEGPADTPGAREVRDEYQRVLRAAAVANIAVYGIDPRGLVAGVPVIRTERNADAAAAAGQMGQASADAMIGRYYGSLGLLATSTGGLLTVDTNDLGKRIPEILRDSRQYYRMAYAQPELTEGKGQPAPRRIEVKVNRPGVEVRARQRYVPG